MIAYRLSGLALLAAGAVWAASATTDVHAAAGAADAAKAFSVRDLVRLERIAEMAVSPNGKSVAYTLRTTDMDANKARTGIWLLDTRKRNASPLRLTDLAANATAATWSADGRHVYTCRTAADPTRCGAATPSSVTTAKMPFRSPVCRSTSAAPAIADLGSAVGEHRGIHRLRRPHVHRTAVGCRPLTRPGTAWCTTSCSCGTGTGGATAAVRSCSASRSMRKASRTGRRS